jgi:Dolichyl-phosphate-mannose-protein mannosyltransferase
VLTSSRVAASPDARTAVGGAAPRRALLTLALLALAVRLAFVWAEPETHPIADETMWVTWGTAVLPSAEVAFSPFLLRFIFHPPVYLYFLGALFALFGSLTAVKIAQAFVAALLVPAVGRLGTLALGPRAGLIAGALVALYPELVWFSVHFWAETLFLTLFWWAVERVAAADRDDSTPTAGVAGLVWGLAVLTRETVLYFAPIAALFLLWRRPKGTRRAALFLLALVLTVAPWTYRNWRVFGAFVPVSTAGALNLWQGNTTLSRQEVYEQYWAVHGKIAKYEFARAQGLRAIGERQPWWIFEKVRDEMPNFWEADSQALVHLRRGAYAEVRPGTAYAVTFVVLGPYLLVLAASVAALATLPRTRLPIFLVAFLAYYNLIHVATHGYARYRLPALPVLFILAGWTFARWRERSRAALPGWRWGVVAASSAVLVASLAPSLRLMLRPGALVDENARYPPGAGPDAGTTADDEASDR